MTDEDEKVEADLVDVCSQTNKNVRLIENSYLHRMNC